MKKINPAHVEEIIGIVKKAPYPAHMAMHLSLIENNYCEVELNVHDFHLQPYGIVHGGVIATIIDTATFWCAYLGIAESDGLVNVDLKLNYLKATRSGLLKCKGKCLRSGKTISYAEAEVRDKKGDLVAHGTSTLMTLPGQAMQTAHAKFIE